MEEGRMEAAVNIFANRRLILFFFAKVFRDKKCIQRIWREKVWIARAKYGVWQCDQMLKWKVAQIFQRFPKNIHGRLYLKTDIFENGPKSNKFLATNF